MPVMEIQAQKGFGRGGAQAKKFEPSPSISLHSNSPKAGDNYKDLVQLLPKDWAGPQAIVLQGSTGQWNLKLSRLLPVPLVLKAHGVYFSPRVPISKTPLAIRILALT